MYHSLKITYLSAGYAYVLDSLGVNTTDPEYALDVNGEGRFKGNVRIESNIPKLELAGEYTSEDTTYEDEMVFEMYQREARLTPWNDGTAEWSARLGYWFEKEYWKTFDTYISADGVVSNAFETSDSGLSFYSATADGVANVLYQTPGRFNIFRNYEDEYTLLCVRSKAADPTDVSNNPREATLALIRTDDDGNEEFVDIYNNGYSDSRQFGIRMQKRGNGEFQKLVIDYSDGSFHQPAMTIYPGATTSEENNTTAVVHNFFECLGAVATYDKYKVYTSGDYQNGISQTIDVAVSGTTHRFTVTGGIITGYETILS